MRSPPDDAALLREARSLKEAVVRTDPYETKGLRVVLNFGHTFGHVLESVSRFSLSHGDAVGLGMLCALDVGVALGVTPRGVAEQVEAALPNVPKARELLAKLVRRADVRTVEALLAGDKKRSAGPLKMVLLADLGRWRLLEVPKRIWARSWTGAWTRA